MTHRPRSVSTWLARLVLLARFLSLSGCGAWISSQPHTHHHSQLVGRTGTSSLAVAPLRSMASSANQQQQQQQQKQQQRHQQQHEEVPTSATLGSAASSSGSGLETELASGRILEGGKVIDFSSVKASDRAEQALAEARRKLLRDDDAATAASREVLLSKQGQNDPILGINDEVIEEVGHDLGIFANAEEVRNCASYLRAKAPPGLLSGTGTDKETLTNEYSADQIRRFEEILDKAYYESGEVTGAFAKTFYMGTMLLPPEARRAIWAVYVWCRRTDEIVDAPRENGDDEMLLDLSSWEMRLEDLWENGRCEDPFDLALLDVRCEYPTMDVTPFRDMIRGMLMDVPGLGQDRYETFEELHLYCYRVAGTVGLMSLPVFGCARGYDDEVAREPALSLGVAFQLTNILRDVGEDAVQRGRVYLPQEDLRQFGVTEEQIFEQRVDDNYVRLMKFEIARARTYYDRARRGVFMLAESSRLPVQSSLDAYGRILDKIEANGYDSLTKRAYVDKWEKLSIIPSSWYRTQEISRVLPLPGDDPVP